MTQTTGKQRRIAAQYTRHVDRRVAFLAQPVPFVFGASIMLTWTCNATPGNLLFRVMFHGGIALLLLFFDPLHERAWGPDET